MLTKKPKFYFNSQKTARITIFWLYVACLLVFLLYRNSLSTYEQRGYIRVPQRGVDSYIHGPDAMTTINFYKGFSASLFLLSAYFSVMYLRIRNAQQKTSFVIVPEREVPELIRCPACLKEKPRYRASDLCAQCTVKRKPPRPPRSNSRKVYEFLYPDFDELTVFLMGYVLCLLFFFNPDCQAEIRENLQTITAHAGLPAVLALVMILLTIFGMVTSFTHLLVVCRKDPFSMTCMKAFALALLMVIGIKSGGHALEHQNVLYMVSPGWNLIMSAVCYTGLGMLDEVPFNQADSGYMQTFLSLVLVSVIFYFLNTVFELYWPITFSLCINYVVCINRGAVNSKFLKLYSVST